MKLDHTPSGIRSESFGEWLDYCVLGAEEVGCLDPEDRASGQALYDRPLTARQQHIRRLCKVAAARHIVGDSA